MTPDERAEATLAAGGSEEQAAAQRSVPTYINPLTEPHSGTATNPILIPSTQSSGAARHTVPSRIPTSHLVPDQGRNPIPGLVRCPNPPQQNALPTIGGPSYASTMARRPQRTNTPSSCPTTAGPTPTPQPALTETQLRARTTTKAMIVQHARDTFNARLSITKTKAELITLYLNLVAARRIPTIPTTTTLATNQPQANPRSCPRKITSDWNICRLPGTETIEFTKPFGGNAYSMVKAIESSLRQALGEANPPITVLAGRWWSPLSSNFTLTLAGNPEVTLVWKYREAILRPFGENIFTLVPNEGQTRIAFQNVPIYRHANGDLPTSAELKTELGKNLQYRTCSVIEAPIWTKATIADPTKTIGAFTILLSNPGRKLAGIMRKPAYMFGQRLTVHFTSRFIPFRQCTRCHDLSHSIEDCKRTPGYSRCHICGRPGHTAWEHAQKCPDAKKHTGLLCDCPIQCFNCVYAGKPGTGHLAIDETCPLKKNMRPAANLPQPATSQATVSSQHTNPTEAPARVDA
jgi:hypothetical protein